MILLVLLCCCQNWESRPWWPDFSVFTLKHLQVELDEVVTPCEVSIVLYCTYPSPRGLLNISNVLQGRGEGVEEDDHGLRCLQEKEREVHRNFTVYPLL